MFKDHYPREAWQTAAACALASLFGPGALFIGTFPLLMVAMVSEFHLGRASLSGAFAASVVVLPVVLPLSGWFIDRFGVRRLLLPAMACYGLVIAGFALWNGSLAVATAMFLLLGAFGFCSSGAPLTKAISGWFATDRGLALGLFVGVATGLGGALWTPVFRWLIDGVGWRTTFALAGGAVLLVCLPAQALLLRDPAIRVAPGRHDERDPIGRHFGDRVFWLLLVAFGTNSFAMMGFRQQSVFILGDRGVDAAAVALLLSMLSVSSIGGQALGGLLVDRMDSPRALLPVFVLSALGFILLVHAGAALTLLHAGAILLGVAMGAENVLLPYVVSRFFGLRHFGIILGALMSGTIVLMGLAPFLLGLAFERSGTYATAFLAMEAALIVGLGATLLLPRYRFAGVRPGAPVEVAAATLDPARETAR